MMASESPDEVRAQLLALAIACRGTLPSEVLQHLDPTADLAESLASLDAPEADRFRIDESLDQVMAHQRVSQMLDLIECERQHGTTLVTIWDESYPQNLRTVVDRPAFLWVRGEPAAMSSASTVAVVGTRKATDVGQMFAQEVAHELSSAGVTVLSGLAAGIDTAAHAGAISGSGLTVAVMGTGTRTVYPRTNQPLAQEIVDRGGALVSQFMPDATPRRWSFPMRNAVMSGMAQATLVIEASETSGAKLQARIALKQRKRLLLWARLVDSESWARRYADKRGAIVISSAADVMEALRSSPPPPDQLRMC